MFCGGVFWDEEVCGAWFSGAWCGVGGSRGLRRLTAQACGEVRQDGLLQPIAAGEACGLMAQAHRGAAGADEAAAAGEEIADEAGLEPQDGGRDDRRGSCR